MAQAPNPDAWERAGLYEPDAPNAADRLALLEYLTDRGATIEEMVEAHEQGSLPAVAGDLVLQGQVSGDRLITVKEVAARTGTSVGRVLRVLLAAGDPADPDTEVPENTVELLSSFEAGSSLMGDEAILAFTRVLGAAAIQIAEAAVALFYAELGPGTERAGEDELTRAKQAEASTLAFTTVPPVLGEMVFDQFGRALRRAVTVRSWGFESGTTADGETQPVAPDATSELVALGFVDLVGSTAWAQRLNLRDQSLALARFESAAWSSAVLCGGRVVKMIGDEVFFSAPSADAACRIGTDAIRAAAEDGVLPPARGAVGLGQATPREGDYFGPLVNLLSRLVKAGEPGQLVVTQPTAVALTPEDWTLQPLEVADLRGISDPVEAFVVESRTRADSTK